MWTHFFLRVCHTTKIMRMLTSPEIMLITLDNIFIMACILNLLFNKLWKAGKK